MLINPQRGNTRGVGLTDVGLPVQNLSKWYVLADTDGRTMTLLPYRSDGTQGTIVTCTANDPAALLMDSLGANEWDDEYVGARILTISGGSIWAGPVDDAADLENIDENLCAVGGWIGRAMQGAGPTGEGAGSSPTVTEGESQEIAVSTVAKRLLGGSSGGATTATANASRLRSIVVTNQSATLSLYVKRATASDGSNAHVTTASFMTVIAPLGSAEVLVFPGQDLFGIRGSASTDTVLAEEALL